MMRQGLVGSLGFFAGVAALAALAVGGACSSVNAAHRDAIIDADKAIKRGDSLGAARAYRNACRAQPSDKKACLAAKNWTARAIDERLAEARPKCEPERGAIDVDGCLKSLAPVRELEPEHPELLRLADGAGAAHVERCLADPPSDPAEAVRLVRCAQAKRSAVATAGYERRMKAALSKAAGVFVDLAAQGAAREAPGAQAILWSAAACLDKDTEIARRAQAARAAFLNVAQASVEVRVSGTGFDAASPAFVGLCGRAADELGARVACRAAAQGGLGLGISASVSPTEHRVSEASRVHRFQSGVRRVANPAFQALSDRVRESERAVRDADNQLRPIAARCEAAREALRRAQECVACAERTAAETACAEAKSGEDLRARRQDELRAQQRDLASTPPTLEDPEFTEIVYVVRTHEWTVAWAAELALAGGAGVRASGSFVTRDEEHGAQRGLEADPLAAPGSTWFHDALAAALAKKAAEVVAAALGERATARRAACVGDTPVWTPAWLGCFAEATLWSGSEPRGLDLLVGAAHAADRTYPDGAVWPAPVCL
jgi:hypothetical protein